MITAGLGVLLLLAATAALAVRYAPIPGHRTLYLVIASPYLMLAAPAAIVVLAWGRRWPLAGLACLLTAVLVAIQVPWFVRVTPDPSSVGVRVMTLNMLYGEADPADMVRVAEGSADILLAQELTPEAVQGLSAAGIQKEFPYRALDARPSSAGVGIYSRYPITYSTRIPGYMLAMVNARVRIPRITHDVSLLSVHLDAPWPRAIDGWHRDLAKLPSTVSEVAAQAGEGAVLIGGDFNSTIDMLPFRQLLANGYQDAARQAGSGRNFTYPANKRYPPVLGIDHVLTRNATAVSTETVEVKGTDHRALLTTIMVPTG
ncbi:endonuclease/exonuclease/phosphatase family protein [Mycolicibacterium hodleri]|uniref:Endonuclease/exonuclease/phosphatase family protein n=1 Tax=Mycolicibacterium hodleri TaxID=49897 RepID=A0A502ECR2_9MYCO|nr:endonuclease/exonuclease/phosphatase family protein [Mycolicibacterium hodleri]TPG34250.1 endonuclease/exonuclease/phosphatase family protein [Mycolicibacterium hodleri]